MPLLDFDKHDVEESPHFELVVPNDGGVTGDPVEFTDFNMAEKVFLDEHMAPVETYADGGESKLRRHHLTTFETKLNHIEKEQQAYVTSELHGLHEPKPRVLWEVYCGGARLSKVAQSMGMKVEEFSYATGWDFNIRAHRDHFLQRLRAEMPDELFLSPECKLWSQMQNITARTEDQQVELQDQRQEHHDTHLRFVAMAYKEQVDGARHAHLEQPSKALSWKTVALRDLPGFHVVFDQCMYGCCCLDFDDNWRLVKKGTGLRTTKAAMAAAMNLRCDGQHAHCRLEGSAPGYGRRTAYLEDYQPGLASTLAAAIFAPELPQCWEYAAAVDEQRAVQGQLIKLYTDSKVEAVRTVQRLHRNLGHPSTEALTELLESRQASEAILEAARKYQCVACLRYKKPNQVAPASIKQVTEFGEKLLADVFWVKPGNVKYPVLSIVDAATKYQTAAVIHAEKGDDYIAAIERCWVQTLWASSDPCN